MNAFLVVLAWWFVVTGGSDAYRDSVGKVIGPFNNVEACNTIRAVLDKYTSTSKCWFHRGRDEGRTL